MLSVFRCSRQLSGGDAEFFPVITVVTNEVRDFAEGLVCDDVLERHGDGLCGGGGVEAILQWRCEVCICVACVLLCVGVKQIFGDVEC